LKICLRTAGIFFGFRRIVSSEKVVLRKKAEPDIYFITTSASDLLLLNNGRKKCGQDQFLLKSEQKRVLDEDPQHQKISIKDERKIWYKTSDFWWWV